ncbi:plasmid partitioning protein RepA [Methylobacterium sp. DB1607]|nr:plasmid partitioning protein RepA [Methylobacterium sp. DB1607]
MAKRAGNQVEERGRSALPAFDTVIAGHAQALSEQLNTMRLRLFPPSAEKQLRRFPTGEAARLIGITDAYLRQITLAADGLEPEKGPAGRRLFTLEQINDLRRHLSRSKPSYLPYRTGGEHLQVIAVTNFKGGSGKTTTAVHLAQYLALQGYRVLAVDLDPQASLSALFGYQPEFDVGENETLYGAIRYDDEQRPLADIVRSTYFTGIDLVPGNLELMEFEHETPRVLLERRRPSDGMFFARVANALSTVEAAYDVAIIDCPPQLGYLTLGALCAATAVLITIHPQMLDIASMSQFLQMTSNLLEVVREAGGNLEYDFLRYLVTRYEPNDGPQAQIVGLLRSLFGDEVLTHAMLKSTAISDAGLTKQTLYEVGREQFTRQTYDRALEALDAVNGEVAGQIARAWGRVPA